MKTPRFVASLPWYDHPSIRPDTDNLWRAISASLRGKGITGLPQALDRETSIGEQWQAPNLLISQCCGLDIGSAPAGNLLAIGRPVFEDLNCEPGDYYSYIVSNGSVPERRRLAVNSLSSHSGSTALFGWLDKQGLSWQGTLVSGSHRASIDMIRNQSADLAAIDAHSWPLLDTAGLVVLGTSEMAPTPPFVSSLSCAIVKSDLFAALQEGIDRQGAGVSISGVLESDFETYRAVIHRAQQLNPDCQRI